MGSGGCPVIISNDDQTLGSHRIKIQRPFRKTDLVGSRPPQEKAANLIPFRLEAAACSASLPGKVKSIIFIVRPSVALPVKG